MKILVFATDRSWNEITGMGTDIDWKRALNKDDFKEVDGMDAYINLFEDASETDYSSFSKSVIINSVSVTIANMNAPEHLIRINGWNGFLSRGTWEVAGKLTKETQKVFEKLRKKIIVVPDEPGFISARIIAMIINEAFFAVEEKVSSKKEIDIAMKLGTNYPYGPFEWAEIIGLQPVYTLLNTLSKTDIRYNPSPGIKETASENK